MEIVSKISKGTKMDQIYIPKNRTGFDIGSYVTIVPLKEEKLKIKPYFYNIEDIEPIKIEIINKIFYIINKITNVKNIIVIGSFLKSGFNFNDIDILIITKSKIKEKNIQRQIEKKLKIKTHVIIMDKDSLRVGLSTDPIWRMMISTCISKSRLLPFPKRKINYKVLDLHLLKSKILINNFDFLDGNEKYKLTRNMIAISLFLEHEKITDGRVDKEIKRVFNLKKVDKIKQNILDKKVFLKKYKSVYNKTFNKIMDGVEYGSKQK